MLTKSIIATLLISHSASLLAAEIKGRITDDQGTGLPDVRICLSVATNSPGGCNETRFTDENGSYSFNGLRAGSAYTVSVLTDASLDARRDDPYPNFAWAPLNRKLQLTSELDSADNIDFTAPSTSVTSRQNCN